MWLRVLSMRPSNGLKTKACSHLAWDQELLFVPAAPDATTGFRQPASALLRMHAAP
jgi:hypothetical protein